MLQLWSACYNTHVSLILKTILALIAQGLQIYVSSIKSLHYLEVGKHSKTNHWLLKCLLFFIPGHLNGFNCCFKHFRYLDQQGHSDCIPHKSADIIDRKCEHFIVLKECNCIIKVVCQFIHSQFRHWFTLEYRRSMI